MRRIDSYEMHRRVRVLRARALHALACRLQRSAAAALRDFAGRLAAGLRLAA